MASLFAKVVELLRADAELSAADIDHVNTAYEQYTVRVRPVATKMCMYHLCFAIFVICAHFVPIDTGQENRPI